MKEGRKEMIVELVKERTKWNKTVVIEVSDDLVSVSDGKGMISKALIESTLPVANAFNAGFWVTSEKDKLWIGIYLL